MLPLSSEGFKGLNKVGKSIRGAFMQNVSVTYVYKIFVFINLTRNNDKLYWSLQD